MNYEKKVVSYQKYGHMLDKLVGMIKCTSRKFDFVYGKPRGAWPIVVHLSHQLGVPIWYTTYHIAEMGTTIRKGSSFLIADDVCDNGHTFKDIKEEADELGLETFFVCLFIKPITQFEPNMFVEETSKWIVFPWERYDERPNR